MSRLIEFHTHALNSVPRRADNSRMTLGQPAPKPSFLARLFPAPVVRAAVIVCIGALIIRVISPAGPQASSAAPAVGRGSAAPMPVATPHEEGESEASTQPKPSGKAPARDPSGRPLLGTLVAERYEVWVYAEGTEPRFSVATREGRVLQQGLTVDEVYRSFPDLPVDTLRMEIVPGGALMHAYPE